MTLKTNEKKTTKIFKSEILQSTEKVQERTHTVILTKSQVYYLGSLY